jgi:methionine synthase I (cobalamin-dependent)
MEINFIPQTIYVDKLDYHSKSINMVRSFLEEIDKRILLFDGAMGTEIQKLKPKPEDFPDNKEGFNDGLILSRPEWIENSLATLFASCAADLFIDTVCSPNPYS